MSDRRARILIVDEQRDAARALRLALESRGYTALDVPSGEEALLELRIPPDLLLTSYRLPGMSGAELLAQVRRRQPGTRAILLAAGEFGADRLPAESEVGHALLFERPASTEELARVVDEVLGAGVAAAGEAEPADAADVERPAPPLDAAVAGMLSALRLDLGAEAIALVDHSGEVLAAHHANGAATDLTGVAALLAAPRHDGLAAYLGGDVASVQYFEGAARDIYTLSAGPEALIAIFFPGGSARQMGAVLRYGRRTASRVAGMLSGAPLLAAPAGGLEPGDAPEPDNPPRPDLPGIEQLLDLSTPGGAVEPVEINLDADELGEAPGDLDAFWEQAAAQYMKVGDDTLSLSEAIELGLYPGEPDE